MTEKAPTEADLWTTAADMCRKQKNEYTSPSYNDALENMAEMFEIKALASRGSSMTEQDIDELLRLADERIAELEREKAELEQRLSDSIATVRFFREQLRQSNAAEREATMELRKKQAKIDSLMLEYCPDEMIQEQLEEWGRNQRPVE